MKKEIGVQLILTAVGLWGRSFWPLMVWCGSLFGGGILLREWWLSATAYSFVGPAATSLVIAVLPINSRHKVVIIAALLTPAILLSLYHFCRIGES